MGTDPITERVRELSEVLEKVIVNQRSRARLNHWTGIVLMAIAIGSSAFAGIAGLSDNGKIPRPWIGGIALIPGFVALLGTSLKFDSRAMWHFRKKRIVQGLLRRLKYELPLVPEADQIAKISADYTAADEEIDSEFEKEFMLNWGLIGGKSKNQRKSEI